jgi:hypothetical protein
MVRLRWPRAARSSVNAAHPPQLLRYFLARSLDRVLYVHCCRASFPFEVTRTMSNLLISTVLLSRPSMHPVRNRRPVDLRARPVHPADQVPRDDCHSNSRSCSQMHPGTILDLGPLKFTLTFRAALGSSLDSWLASRATRPCTCLELRCRTIGLGRVSSFHGMSLACNPLFQHIKHDFLEDREHKRSKWRRRRTHSTV